MKSEKLSVKTDGLDLVVEWIGSGPTILFGHGLSGNRGATLEQLESLSTTHRVVAFDQRGHGESSPVVDPDLYEPRRMAEDMGAILDAIEAPTAVIGGESMGAALAMLFAEAHPDRVERLLLTAPAFGDEPNPERLRIQTMAEIIEKHGIDAFLKGAAERQRVDWGAPEGVITKLASMQRSHDPKSLVVACRTVIEWIITPRLENFERLECPALVLGWPDDGLHPEALARRLSEVLPRARLEWLPSMFEVFERPHAVGAIFRDFLDSAASAER